MHFVEQKYKLQMKRNPKSKIPHTVLEKRTLCFSSYKNRKLKIKLSCVGAYERKKGHFCNVFFFLSEGNFFKVCVLSQCIVYLIHFQNIYIITYQETLLHTVLLLVSKIVERRQCILE